MMIKRVLFFLIFVFSAAGAALASAPSSQLYEYYLSEGKKSLERHEDLNAYRYFRWARQIDPSQEEPDLYIGILSQRFISLGGVGGEAEPSGADPHRYQALMSQGKEALSRNDLGSAAQFFYDAQQSDPKAAESLEYLNLVKRFQEKKVVPVDRTRLVAEALDRFEGQGPHSQDPDVPPHKKAQAPQEPPAGKDTLAAKKKTGHVDIVPVQDIVQASQARPTLRVELGSSVIIEGKNIQKLLTVDQQGTFNVQTVARDQIQVSPTKMGSSFLHIWEDGVRTTIYLEAVIPKTPDEDLAARIQALEHSQRFRFIYSNEWNSYYYGEKTSDIKRRRLNFYQTVGVDGETPYGFLDASATLVGFNPVKSIPTYTVGFSRVPFKGTQDLNLRFFDASRAVSALTLPGTHLRGAFMDVKLFQDIVGVSVSHGQLQPVFGYSLGGGSTRREVYLNGIKITLFPNDPHHHYSFNYARGYGADRDPSLARQVYSIDGVHKIDKWTLSGELARENEHVAAVSGLKWGNGGLHTSLHVRDINRSFMTVTSAPSSQGEVGAMWITNAQQEKWSAGSVVDVYRDKQYFNPDNPDALNYDTNAFYHLLINPRLWVDTSARYIDTSGELSPRRNAGLDARLTRSVQVWGGRQGTVYIGGGYQRSRYAFSKASEFDRYSALTGLQVPLTVNLSYYANYEYSWLFEPLSDGEFNPNVVNTGINYSRNLTEKISGNYSLAYRKESNLGGTNSFLSGEDSVLASAGLNYNPNSDVTYFIDGRVRRAWSLIDENPSYYDMDIRLGVRGAWGLPVTWDPRGVVAGVVFKDKNGNGKFDGDDEGIQGVRMKIGDTEVKVDEHGRFRQAVRARYVTVAPVVESVPQGFIFSTPTFHKVKILQGRTEKVAFGLTTNSGIYGVVFVDNNGNGVPDQGDQFIRQVKLILDGDLKETSGPHGDYFFKNVGEGKHRLSLDMMTLPPGLLPQVKVHNDIEVKEGITYIFHVPMKIKPDSAEGP
jgi:hypothetical protein